MAHSKGFTLIELMIVVVILGILAAIGLPNYFSLKENAARASCFSNQRYIVEAASLYVIEKGVVTTTINVTALQGLAYINTPPSECPESGDGSSDDYTITIVNERVDVMRCDIAPAKHLWTGFK